MTSKKPALSFEFFPPKDAQGREHLMEHVHALAKLDPAFMTVTYGAGGSTKDWTMETAVRVQKETGIATASHLTCINVFKEGIHEMAESLWQNNIRHIIALRGDVPQVDMPLEYSNMRYYHYANELIEGLRGLRDFEISVAAYPEKHPEARDLSTDIVNLKRKCEKGVSRAITQFFFDNDVYFRFLELTQKAGITTPIVPGLLPIADFTSMLRFAARCQAGVPQWLHDRFEGLENPEDRREVALEIMTEQVRGLVAAGVPHIHFYTLNKAGITEQAIRAAGLGQKNMKIKSN